MRPCGILIYYLCKDSKVHIYSMHAICLYLCFIHRYFCCNVRVKGKLTHGWCIDMCFICRLFSFFRRLPMHLVCCFEMRSIAFVQHNTYGDCSKSGTEAYFIDASYMSSIISQQMSFREYTFSKCYSLNTISIFDTQIR